MKFFYEYFAFNGSYRSCSLHVVEEKFIIYNVVQPVNNRGKKNCEQPQCTEDYSNTYKIRETGITKEYLTCVVLPLVKNCYSCFSINIFTRDFYVPISSLYHLHIFKNLTIISHNFFSFIFFKLVFYEYSSQVQCVGSWNFDRNFSYEMYCLCN